MVIEQARLDYTLLLDSQAGYLLAEGPNPVNISMEAAPSENAKTYPLPSTCTSLSQETAKGPSVDGEKLNASLHRTKCVHLSVNKQAQMNLKIPLHRTQYKILDSTHDRVQLLNLVGMRPQLTTDHCVYLRHGIQLLTVDHSRQTDLGVRTISYFCNRRTYYRNLCYPNDRISMKDRNGKFSYRGAPGPSRGGYRFSD
ncbi:hypothetical protein GG344DRAFT_64909 [Lentinula edodes]|nr:hypothetical protein GG344DRAFT_64909 [Lentinula edodes]